MSKAATFRNFASGLVEWKKRPVSLSACLTTDTAGELPAIHADQFEKLAVQFIKKTV
ncbi:hypothetical protein ACN22W_19430 [Burkholderia theae]|uniref:hypothetical protein n=1 Tax=Burkholderia theae TaxID=3143496 RepID=UPI003AFA528E